MSLGRACAVIFGLVLLELPAAAGTDTPSIGADYYERWLDEVGPLIAPAERAFFHTLRDDEEREEFIHGFWLSRTFAPNQARLEWTERAKVARERYGELRDDRARATLLLGPPTYRVSVGNSLSTHPCGFLRPLTLFYFSGRDDDTRYAVFSTTSMGIGHYQLWRPSSGLEPLLALPRTEAHEGILRLSRQEGLARVLEILEVRGCFRDRSSLRGVVAAAIGAGDAPDLTRSPFPPVDQAWIRELGRQPDPTDRVEPPPPLAISHLPADDKVILDLEVGLRIGSDPSVSGDYERVAVTAAFIRRDANRPEYSQFAQQYWVPRAMAGKDTSVHLASSVRPGTYALVIHLYVGEARPRWSVQTVDVPASPASVETASGELPGFPPGLAADAVTLEIPGGRQFGPSEIRANVMGRTIRSVRFVLDGTTVAHVAKPPFRAVVDLGQKPHRRRLEAIGLSETATEVARDALVLQQGPHTFEVRVRELRSPQAGSSAVLQILVEPPVDGQVAKVDLFADDAPLGSLGQPPWIYRGPLDASGRTVVRAVAVLTDGRTAEGTFVRGAEYGENIDVRVVEVYLTAESGRDSGPDLAATQIEVLENGKPQVVTALERTSSLPLAIAVMADGSSTMLEELELERQASVQFFRNILGRGDRAAFLVFNQETEVVVPFTTDLRWLEDGTTALRAGGGTALYNGLIESLYYFGGLSGQRAIVLLSDGRDEGSIASFDEVLDFVRRAGVTVYPIQLDVFTMDPSKSNFTRIALRDAAANELRRLAKESGGLFHAARSTAELPRILARIERDLRHRYRVSYQSNADQPDGSFRTIEVRIRGRNDVKLRTVTGYYPR